MAWTDQMVEDLKKMWDEGLTTGEIGKRLGVSKNSIVGKVHRLQLVARPSPIKKKETTETAEKPSAAPAKAPKAPKAEPTVKKEIKEEKKAEKTEAPKEKETVSAAPVKPQIDRIETIRNSSHVEHPKGKHKTSLTDLDNHTCRWPIGDPKDENFHFCGRKVKIGQTYCEEHAAIAYVKATGKK